MLAWYEVILAAYVAQNDIALVIKANPSETMNLR